MSAAASTRARLGGEGGFAVPLAMSILAMTALLVLAVVAFATHSTDRANRDRQAARAQQAADAGLDAALYRMNKALVASQVEGVLGVPADVLATAECVDVSVGSLSLVESSGGWCPASSGSEQIDGPGTEGDPWAPASFSYATSTGINLGTDPNDSGAYLVEREIVSTGTVDDVDKRVIGTVRVKLGVGGNLLAVFEQIGYRTCTPEPPDPGDPASGC